MADITMQADIGVAVAVVLFALACAGPFFLAVYVLSKPRPRINSREAE